MIEFRVVSRAGLALDMPLIGRFGDAGGTIGRGADCTLVLPDPERRMSRRQLQVKVHGGMCSLRLLSAHLVVELDGRPMTPDVDHPVAPGAEIRMAGFLMQVVNAGDLPLAGEHAQTSASARRPRERQDQPVAAAAAPLALPSPAIDVIVGDAAEAAEPGPAAAPAAAAPAAAAPEPIAALFAGLGLPPDAAAPPSAETLRLIGSLLRACLDGTLGLLAARTIAKRELGAGATLLRTRENNPLKFSPDVDTALGRLLGPGQRGFMPPLAALEEAYDDLRAHQVAVLAGTRAALDAVLQHFSPAALEQRLSPKGLWDNLVPAMRRSELWARYAEHHAQIMQEAEDHFDRLYAHAFLEAYQAQLALLGRETDAAPLP